MCSQYRSSSSGGGGGLCGCAGGRGSNGRSNFDAVYVESIFGNDECTEPVGVESFHSIPSNFADESIGDDWCWQLGCAHGYDWFGFLKWVK